MRGVKKEYPWFKNQEWDKIHDILVKTNTGMRMAAAIRAVYYGKSYGEASRLYNVSKQNIGQWLERTDAKINRGDLEK